MKKIEKKTLSIKQIVKNLSTYNKNNKRKIELLKDGFKTSLIKINKKLLSLPIRNQKSQLTVKQPYSIDQLRKLCGSIKHSQFQVNEGLLII